VLLFLRSRGDFLFFGVSPYFKSLFPLPLSTQPRFSIGSLFFQPVPTLSILSPPLPPPISFSSCGFSLILISIPPCLFDPRSLFLHTPPPFSTSGHIWFPFSTVPPSTLFAPLFFYACPPLLFLLIFFQVPPFFSFGFFFCNEQARVLFSGPVTTVRYSLKTPRLFKTLFPTFFPHFHGTLTHGFLTRPVFLSPPHLHVVSFFAGFLGGPKFPLWNDFTFFLSPNSPLVSSS